MPEKATSSRGMAAFIEPLPMSLPDEPLPTGQRGKTQSPPLHHQHQHQHQQKHQQQLSLRGISDIIEQIKHCEAILASDLASPQQSQPSSPSMGRLSERLLAKAQRLSSLEESQRRQQHRRSTVRSGRLQPRARPASLQGLDRNNNKCCNAVTSSNAVTADAPTDRQDVNTDSVDDHEGEEEGEGRGRRGASRRDAVDSPSGSERDGGGGGGGGGSQSAYPKHQDYCLCHKRKCQRCGCLCPCSEHACPSCGYTSRVVMTMRAVDGLKAIANAQKARFRNGRMAPAGKCKQRRKRFLMSEAGGECSHAVMVRVGGGFVPLVEYLKSHNKVVLSKFTRGDGSAFLSPWRPYYAGPLKKGRPRGIRYVDSVTQQLEELIFANREAGKSHCICP